MRSAIDRKRCVISMSSLLGVGSPLGWLCATTNAAALARMIALNTSRGCTIEAVRLPTLTSSTPMR